MKRRAAFVLFCALVAVLAIHYSTNHLQGFRSIRGHTVPATSGPSALVRSLRPIYPYSVIPGGAYSPGELQFADSKDRVMRAHYADFDIKHARLERLTDDRFQYVSYRIKDQVYWTKKKLRIPKGELLLTDGGSYARARCGNRLSDKPAGVAVSSQEPAAAMLSLPAINQEMLPLFALANAPALGDIPAGAPAIPLAISPGDVPASEVFSNAGQPVVPVESEGGSGPIVGSGFVSPAAPIGAVGGSSVSPGGLSSGSNQSTHTPVPPITTGTGAPPEITPVPEPSSIFLFLISLGVSIWGLMRMLPKDDGSKT